MFRKSSASANARRAPSPAPKESYTGAKLVPSVIASDFNLLGNIISEGTIDFDGKIDGNIHCHTLVIRKHAVIGGEVTAEIVHVYGRVKGLIRARQVSLFSSAIVEGVVMHQSLAIADGAVIDGSIKRTDKAPSDMSLMDGLEDAYGAPTQFLEGFRLLESTEPVS